MNKEKYFFKGMLNSTEEIMNIFSKIKDEKTYYSLLESNLKVDLKMNEGNVKPEFTNGLEVDKTGYLFNNNWCIKWLFSNGIYYTDVTCDNIDFENLEQVFQEDDFRLNETRNILWGQYDLEINLWREERIPATPDYPCSEKQNLSDKERMTIEFVEYYNSEGLMMWNRPVSVERMKNNG